MAPGLQLTSTREWSKDLKDGDENSIREVIKVEKKMLVLKKTILIFLSFWHDSEQIWKKKCIFPL